MKRLSKNSFVLSLISILIFSVCLTACQDYEFDSNSITGYGLIGTPAYAEQIKETIDLPDIPEQANCPDTIKIASFNIQVFGKTKAGKPKVMEIITDIITQFDIVAIQEIRDKSGTAITRLENLLDATGTDYNYIIGPRLGRSSSKEQYAYIYNTDTIEAIGDPYTYDDSAKDIFHREPFIAQFKAKNGTFDFTMVTIHTDPDSATEEIYALHQVIEQARAFTGESDIIALGDFNADCNYHEESNRGPLSEDSYIYAIKDSADTNLAKSDCTYDRIIMTKSSTETDFTGMSGVYRFDTIHSLSYNEAKKVSDHYPVYAVFSTNKDAD